MNPTFEERIARLFSMTDEVWEKHANPWSVWTRFSALPLLIVAIWSRLWIGPWAWALVSVTIYWIWINPRLFKKPLSTDNWASKAVLGERVWLNRKTIPVPRHHRIMPNLLNVISAAGLPLLIWGLVQYEWWPTLSGIVLIYTGKVWFLDRMVWLYEDMKDASPEYSKWLYNTTSKPSKLG